MQVRKPTPLTLRVVNDMEAADGRDGNSRDYHRNFGIARHAGGGDPEGSQSASPGSMYMRTNGTIYRKSTGTGNTGWVAMS